MREKRRWSSEEGKDVCPGTVKTDRQTQSYLVQQVKSWSQATEMNRSGFGQACCWEKKTTDPEKACKYASARGAHLVESVFAQKCSRSLPRGGLHCSQPVAFHLHCPCHVHRRDRCGSEQPWGSLSPPLSSACVLLSEAPLSQGPG